MTQAWVSAGTLQVAAAGALAAIQRSVQWQGWQHELCQCPAAGPCSCHFSISVPDNPVGYLSSLQQMPFWYNYPIILYYLLLLTEGFINVANESWFLPTPPVSSHTISPLSPYAPSLGVLFSKLFPSWCLGLPWGREAPSLCRGSFLLLKIQLNGSLSGRTFLTVWLNASPSSSKCVYWLVCFPYCTSNYLKVYQSRFYLFMVYLVH